MSERAREVVDETRKRALTLWDEFQAFALKGNVVDLAVGVIIGGAFGTIVKSLVDHLIMPLVSLIIPSEHGYRDWTLVVGGKTVPFGLFIADVINFLIVAVALFFFIKKFLAWILRTRKEEIAQIPPMTKDQELLTEIRDLLKASAPRAPA